MSTGVWIAIAGLVLVLAIALVFVRKSLRSRARGRSDQEARQAFFRSVSEKGHSGEGESS